MYCTGNRLTGSAVRSSQCRDGCCFSAYKEPSFGSPICTISVFCKMHSRSFLREAAILLKRTSSALRSIDAGAATMRSRLRWKFASPDASWLAKKEPNNHWRKCYSAAAYKAFWGGESALCRKTSHGVYVRLIRFLLAIREWISGVAINGCLNLGKAFPNRNKFRKYYRMFI